MVKPRLSNAVAAAIMVAGSMAGVGATAAPASAETLGGVDLVLACGYQHVGGSVPKYRKYSDPFSWYCAAATWPYYSLGGIDMNKACAMQYGQGASAGLAAWNVYAWYCKR